MNRWTGWEEVTCREVGGRGPRNALKLLPWQDSWAEGMPEVEAESDPPFPLLSVSLPHPGTLFHRVGGASPKMHRLHNRVVSPGFTVLVLKNQ